MLQEVVFREESEKNGLGVAPRSCFGVQGGCFLSSLSEGSPLPHASPFSFSLFPISYGLNKGSIQLQACEIMLKHDFWSLWLHLVEGEKKKGKSSVCFDCTEQTVTL